MFFSRRVKSKVLGIPLVLLLGLSGCASGNKIPIGEYELSAHTPKAVGEIANFKWALSTEPFSLDPAYAFDYADNTVLANICESLLRWNSDLSISAGLAEKVSHPDPKTWVYQIRRGVRFHDGSVMQPEDVVVSLKRHMDPEVASFWADSFKNVQDIVVSGQNEVTVHLVQPDAQFNQLMAAAPGVVESAETLRKAGKNYGNAQSGVNCTGPFSFNGWRPGEQISLKRFSAYWDKANRAKAKSMDFVILNDSNARVNALQTGEVDGAWQVPSNAINLLRASDTGKMYFGTNTTVQSIVISNLQGPLGDVRVRRALSLALDRVALTRAAVQGYGEPTLSLTSASVWKDGAKKAKQEAFKGLSGTDYNIAEARKLVREAGAEGAKITYVTAPLDPSFDVIARAVASAGKEIGLDIELETRTPNSYTLLFSDPGAIKGVDMFATTWYLSTTDPLELFAVIRTGQFSNYGKWSNKKFDEVVTAALQVDDPEERSFLSAEAQQIASADLPWIPLIEIPTNVWLGKRISGVDPSIYYMYYPWAASIGKADNE